MRRWLAEAPFVLAVAFCSSVVPALAEVPNVPALVVGGVANFVGNRHFAFRARGGSLTRHALGYTAVEVVALVLNGVLYDLALRVFPGALHLYWLVRIVTSHLVFLCWSYPLWRKVFRDGEPITA